MTPFQPTPLSSPTMKFTPTTPLETPQKPDLPWYGEEPGILAKLLWGVTEPFEQLHEALPWGGDNPSAIGIDTETGAIDPGKMVPFGLGAAGTAATGSLAFARPPNSLGMFGGRIGAQNLAKAGRPGALGAIHMAEYMEKHGASPLEIWEATAKHLAKVDPELRGGGVARGRDGQWRFEISDEGLAVTPQRRGGDMNVPVRGRAPLPEMVSHPQLEAAYPRLYNGLTGQIELRPGDFRGRYARETGQLDAQAQTRDDLRSVVAHELEHRVQNLEGFAPGGMSTASPEELAGMPTDRMVRAYSKRLDDINAELSSMPPTIVTDQALIDRLTELMAEKRMAEEALDALNTGRGWPFYRWQAGETEARNVQSRLEMTPEQRAASPPWATQDVPDEWQIEGMPHPIAFARPPRMATGGRF